MPRNILVGNERLKKSNRSASDFFELLLVQYICHQYGLTFSYSNDLSEIMDRLLRLDNSEERIKLQNNNFKKIKDKVREIIDLEIGNKGRLINVIWTGRDLTIQTTSDVDATHETNKLTRFSVKSIAGGGTGTVKNIGLKKIEAYYKIDYQQEYKKMWDTLKNKVGKEIPQSKIKNICKNDRGLLERAENNYRPYQKELNEVSCRKFNELSAIDKLKIIEGISDSKDPDLYVIIVNNKKDPIIYKPMIKYGEKFSSDISSELSGDTGFFIKIDNVPLYRVETSCTNGLGISAMCQRFFLA